MEKQTMEQVAARALETGFSHAAALDASTLTPLDEVRAMCAVDKCHMYGRCWTCPPGCGSVEENTQTIRRYSAGVIVQTTRTLEDDFDYETMESCAQDHKAYFGTLHAALRDRYPDMLALGAGGCRLCDTCTYPDAPCRRPKEALSSMEAYGLLVSDVCTQNGLKYYYGPQTMTYTGCYLLLPRNGEGRTDD